jgi:hypothetical protein
MDNLKSLIGKKVEVYATNSWSCPHEFLRSKVVGVEGYFIGLQSLETGNIMWTAQVPMIVESPRRE